MKAARHQEKKEKQIQSSLEQFRAEANNYIYLTVS